MMNTRLITQSIKNIYRVGEAPPVGHVPTRMWAQLIRPSRFGEPRRAFELEAIDVPELDADEVLVYVMAAGINYNNVWAALGSPVNVISERLRRGDPHAFHIGGSDASGVVYAVGSNVTTPRLGEHVVLHCGRWDLNCPRVRAGTDPTLSPTFKIWGYETNWGSFAQFTKVQAHQCLPKPPQLTWEQAAAYMLTGATAYRMLLGARADQLHPGEVVLIWGGSGGLGCMAIQIARTAGAIPVAVVSDDKRGQFCLGLGARGYVNRTAFTHWGPMPHWRESEAYGRWGEQARAFGRAIWSVVGERKSPRVVFEHPGEDTISTSMFVCDTGGSVVVCAGTTGYNAVVDLRHVWMRQKRLVGSHFANDEECAALNAMVADGRLSPCLSDLFRFEDLGAAHQLMYENRLGPGNAAALVGAPAPGLSDLV